MKIKDYDTSRIVIEKNVPKQHGGGRDDKWFFIFSKMAVGDSFAIPFKEEPEANKIKGAMYQAACGYRSKTDNEFKWSMRVLFIKKEVRFWRDK